jgi:glucose-6-phosphate isomerase
MTTFAVPPLAPFSTVLDFMRATFDEEGPILTRRMSDLEGLFEDASAWRKAIDEGDPVVYRVVLTPVPEVPRELPHSITTIEPGDTAGELWMTKGHQHPDPQGEIYVALRGRGGLVEFDGTEARFIDMTPGTIGYIPPGWAHRSVNVGTEPYSFLAVYPGSAGHDYGWVLEHGMGYRTFRRDDGYALRAYRAADRD